MKMENINNKFTNMNKHENAGDKISESFCIVPWIHLHTWPNGDVFPCCLSNSDYPIGDLKKNTLREIWNSEDLKGLRKEMLENKKPEICKRCVMQEDVGSYSFRIASNNKWKHRIDKVIETTDVDGYSHDFNLIYWDFRFSNICNFKCRMCGPELSSSLYDDQIKMYGSSTTPKALMHVNDNSVENIIDYVNEFVNDVEEINFAGGEPLIMDEHYIILEKLINAGNVKCKIRYNTNFSKLKHKNWDAIELWNKLPKDNIQIYTSLDAIGSVAEYVRKGTKWKEIEENIKLVQKNGLRVYISSTVSLLTVFELPKFIDRMLELNILIDDILMHNILTFPDYYCVNILPDNLKEKLINVLDEHSNSISDSHIKSTIINNYNIIKKYLYMKPERDIKQLILDFKKYTTIKDKHRKDSFIDIYPYYKEWFESI